MNYFLIKYKSFIKNFYKIFENSPNNVNYFDIDCKKCRYFSKNSGICTIFNRQSFQSRKKEIWCGKEAEFFREIKIYRTHYKRIQEIQG